MQRGTKHTEETKAKMRRTIKKYYRDLKENRPDEYQDFCNKTSLGMKRSWRRRKNDINRNRKRS